VLASDKVGGAVYIHNKSVLHSKGGAISNCTFIGNSSANSGGAFYASSTNSDWYAICQDCRFYENRSAYGGGAYATGNTILTNCVFQGNTATQYGGGLRLSGNALCQDCTIESNVAPNGSGAYISGNAVVSGCKFVRNGKTDATSSVSPNYGGGVYLASGSCVGCDFIDNFCDNAGGAYVTSTSAEIRDCLFERNRQTGWNSGAAILVKSSTPLALVSNCVFNANIANNWSARTIISNAELVDCVISNHCLNGYLLAGCNMTRCLVSDNIVYGNGLNLDIDTVYGKTEVFRTNVNCIVVGNVASNVLIR
jgi:predicted outer membrane repeat protein